MSESSIAVCSRCVLPSTFPGVSFDDAGVCNQCAAHRPGSAGHGQMASYEDKFKKLMDEKAGKSTYDVLMAYSGGKDSTYTLDIFVNRYRLRVLAVTLDNTFVSERAFTNMKNVCANLRVDHLIVRPAEKMLRGIFSRAAQCELYSAKTLERASTICTSCISFVKGISLRTAIEKEIPFVGYGWSPGQAPIQSSVMKTNAAFARSAQKAVFEPLHGIAGDAISPFFVTEEQFAKPEAFPWNVHPLAFLDYDEAQILERNRQLGWEKPDDTDPNSTNCLLNAYANHVHQSRYGFNPYAWEIANMVRGGVMTRAEGLKKMETPEDPERVRYAAERL